MFFTFFFKPRFESLELLDVKLLSVGSAFCCIQEPLLPPSISFIPSFRGLQQSVQRATAHRGVDARAINEGNDHGVDFESLDLVYDAF